MATYNGHKNWNHWNVSLWLHNDYGLYQTVDWFCSTLSTKDEAASAILDTLRGQATPDGAPYTFSSIRAALRY